MRAPSWAKFGYGVAAGTVAALAAVWAISSTAADHVVRPVEVRLSEHVLSSELAQNRQDVRMSFVVESLAALCKATPGADCPPPIALVRDRP